MSFGTSTGGSMVPTTGFPFPAVTSGSFTIVKTGVYEAHLVGGGAGGASSPASTIAAIGGGGGAVVFAKKLYKTGDVINYIVGAAGLGAFSNVQAIFDAVSRNGGQTIFDQYAANGGIGRIGGAITDNTDTNILNIGLSGGWAYQKNTGQSIGNLVGELFDSTKTTLNPEGGASVYGKSGAAFGANATGYGAGGAKGSSTVPGGNGAQGCIWLFGPL